MTQRTLFIHAEGITVEIGPGTAWKAHVHSKTPTVIEFSPSLPPHEDAVCRLLDANNAGNPVVFWLSEIPDSRWTGVIGSMDVHAPDDGLLRVRVTLPCVSRATPPTDEGKDSGYR